MKINYLLFIVSIVSYTTSAQIVNIPDANFKNVLVNTNCAVIGSNQTTTSDVDLNDDGEIQVSEAAMVTKLYLSNQGISDLTGIEAFTALEVLLCNNNAISNLTLNNFSNLRVLNCSYNGMAHLNITNCFNLYSFDCVANSMTTIDLSTTIVYKFYIVNNPNLTYLNIKNGFVTDGYYNFKTMALPPPPPSCLDGSPNLSTICCDETEVFHIVNYISFGFPLDPSVNVNSYCTSSPGGSYNTILGNVTLNCDGAQAGIRNQKIEFNNATQTGYTFTNYGGGYTFYTGTNALTVTPKLSNPEYFTVAPNNYVFNFSTSGLTENADFCLTSNGNHPDLSISAYPLNNARPGFNSQYMLVLTNTGNQIQSGNVVFTFNGAVFDYVASFPTANNWATNAISWNFLDLAPNQSKSWLLVLHLNSPQDTPPVVIGDVLDFQASVSSAFTDETPNNNQKSFTQTVVGSFDPNDKIVVEGESISIASIGDYLHYRIRFQNTGTAPAEKIVIRDLLDNHLDWSTLEIVSSSHPYRSTLTSGNRFEVFYDEIHLPPSVTDEEGSNGYIAYKIKPKNTVAIDDIISNTASIYFDYNFPIITNTVTTAVTALGTATFNGEQLFTLYPNPVRDQFQVSVSSGTSLKTITVYNALGQHVITTTNQNVINLSALSKGVYFVVVETGSGSATRKIIKL